MTNIRILATWLKNKGTRGATMVEYVLLVALVALVGAFGWSFVGGAISATSDNVCESVKDANETASMPAADGTTVTCDDPVASP